MEGVEGLLDKPVKKLLQRFREVSAARVKESLQGLKTEWNVP